MRVIVDVKNLGLYSGGVASYVTPLLKAWIMHRPNDQFYLIGPEFKSSFLADSHNWTHELIKWPVWLPRVLRHPYYDNVLFPRAMRRLKPDFVYSPYHDVRMNIDVPTIITIHDTCLEELSNIYPKRIRWYYLAMLQHNLRHCKHVITVSEVSKSNIHRSYTIDMHKLHIIRNTYDAEFLGTNCDAAMTHDIHRQYTSERILFYPGGNEHRKNVSSLFVALSHLILSGVTDWVLLITGDNDRRWQKILSDHDPKVVERIRFLGKLDLIQLKQYFCAADVVIYPTLCEGFGRVCMEAMIAGAPLACSDLPVLHEVAGDYAHYFNPHQPTEIAKTIESIIHTAKPKPVFDQRFELNTVQHSFYTLMDKLMQEPVQV